MLRRLRYVVLAGLFAIPISIATAPAQDTLGFTIDPNQGLPGITVEGQVDVDDIAESCVTDLAEFQSRFEALISGPFAGGGPSGELFDRFFPEGEFVFETCEQAAYSLTGLVAFGIALNVDGAAEEALPQTFVMTFADIATQEPVGERGNFDPTTGEGSVVVPDVDPGLWAVAATCVGPTFDIDILEAGIRENGAFLEGLGMPCDINSLEFGEFVEEFLGEGATVFDFLAAVGPNLLEPIVTLDALGVQLFTVLDQPETKDECKAGGWRQFPGFGFRNQGDCIRFFLTGGLPAGTSAAMRP